MNFRTEVTVERQTSRLIGSPRRHNARNNWTRSDHKFLGSPLNYTTLHLVKTAAYIGVRRANNSRLSRTFRTISRHTRSVYSHSLEFDVNEREYYHVNNFTLILFSSFRLAAHVVSFHLQSKKFYLHRRSIIVQKIETLDEIAQG